MLQLAIGEYEKLTQLEPKDVETHLLLGQLYGLNHDTSKAEAQFKLAQGLDSNSEEAVLNMARLYSEQGEPQQAVDALSAIPSDDRTARINFALGTAYDQLKEFKKAAVAYRAALDDEPDNPGHPRRRWRPRCSRIISWVPHSRSTGRSRRPTPLMPSR